MKVVSGRWLPRKGPPMTEQIVASDMPVIDLLRKRGSMTVSELAEALDVTATAVRQRLSRLLAQGFIERWATRAGRGRPSHRYRLTDKGRRQAGANFSDLVTVLWREVCAIEAPEVRRGLIERISRRMVELYADRIDGTTVGARMRQLADLFQQRRIPLVAEMDGTLPVLTALACPYPGLADQQRSICAMERQMMGKLLGTPVRLRACRLDGAPYCQFAPSDPAVV